MLASAARMGTSPLLLDWTQLALGGGALFQKGFSPEDSRKAWDQLKARFDRDEVGFYHSPIREELSQLQASIQLARESLSKGFIRDCLFLGIGGSSLGPKALLNALVEERTQSIRFHFMENPDPLEWKTTLSTLQPESTLVCIVTKSGSTFETLAQASLALEWLGKSRWRSHVVAMTDPKKGELRAFVEQEGIPTLTIAPSIGGRFSIFSPVGLFPATLAGLDAEAFIRGANQVRTGLENVADDRNPLFQMASLLLRQSLKRPIHVCMPYTSRLKTFGEWFVQLWAESLGKDGKGYTPLPALGAVDQHSLLQLLRDGPDDKITWFVTLSEVNDPVRIPKAPPSKSSTPFPTFSMLEGHTLHELLRVEFEAVSKVLTRRERPHLKFQLERLDAESIGAFCFAMCSLTALTGTLLGVDPFDQPGVEEGKIYIREALGTRSEA